MYVIILDNQIILPLFLSGYAFYQGFIIIIYQFIILIQMSCLESTLPSSTCHKRSPSFIMM